MKIQEYNNHITKYNKVVSKNSLSKDVISKNKNSEPNNSIHKEASNCWLPPFKRINNYITPYRLKESKGEVNDKKLESSSIDVKVVGLVNENISKNYIV